MVNALDLRVALQGDGIKAHRAELLERRLERCQTLGRGVGFDEFVLRQNGLTQRVPDRNQRMRKVARLARLAGAPLAFQRKGVHIGAAKAFQRRNQVGADALRHKQRGAVGFRVLRPGAAVGANRHAAHAFNATGDHQVFPARAHLLRGQVHGVQAGGAKPVDLHARGAKVPARLERRHFCNDRALFAHRRDHAHHHVIDRGSVKAVAPLQLGQHTGQQVDGLDFVQAAVFFAFAAWRANGVVNECFDHGGFP